MWSEDRKKLVDERGQLLAEAKGLHEQDEMSAEDKERFDGAIAKAEEVREQIEEGDQKAKADAEREERLAKAEQWEHESKGVLPGMANGGSDPDAPPDPLAGTVLEQKGSYVGKNSEEHGWFPYCTKAEFNRNPQLKAIARPEYKAAWMDYMTRGVESKALTEGVDTEGGYLVPHARPRRSSAAEGGHDRLDDVHVGGELHDGGRDSGGGDWLDRARVRAAGDQRLHRQDGDRGVAQPAQRQRL